MVNGSGTARIPFGRTRLLTTTTMENVSEGALKRPLDEDVDGDDRKKPEKKLKTGSDLHQVFPNMKNEKDEIKWNLLPSIVYELLALIKNSENVNSDEDKQDKIDKIIKEDLSIQNCKENIVDNAFKHENMKEVDICDEIIIENSNLQVSNIVKDSTQDLNKLDFSAKYSTEDVSKNVPLITKASPVKLFAENTDVDKIKQTEDESNGKTSVVKKQLMSIHSVCHLSVFTKNVHCTDSSTNYISKTVMSTENVSNAATSANSIYNIPVLTSDISISNIGMLSSTNNNTLIVPENSAHIEVISRTENIFRVQLLEFLNKNCLDSISGVPLTKPYPCICNGCTVVNNLPIEQSTVYSLFFTSSDQLSCTNLDSDMNSSNVPVADCSISATNDCNVNKSNTLSKLKKTLINTDSSKNIWINELASLIIKNENTSKRYIATVTNASEKLNPMQNVINKVHRATQHIKSRFLLCNKCPKSKYGQSYYSCKCYSRYNKYKYDKYDSKL